MTVIGAIPAIDKNRNITHYVMFADSMGSVEASKTKYDNRQKILTNETTAIATCGTSAFQTIIHNILQTHTGAPAREVSRRLREMLEENPEHDAGFLVAGKENNGPALYHVERERDRRTGEPTTRVSITQKIIAVDGSGSPYAEEQFRLIKSGPHKTELADAFSYAQDCAKAGARDSGVNDKVQYALISPQGISVLYHPDTVGQLDNTERAKFLSSLSGIDLKPETEDITYRRKDWDVARILGSFYHMFTSDLDIYTMLRNQHNNNARILFYEDGWRQNFEETLQIGREARVNLEMAINAFETKGMPAIAEYQQDFDARRKDIRERTLELYVQQTTPAAQ